ncbi:hypothetical protein HYT01_02310, partial [Candidatus Giovannonibacteria bacterium]|nr:hypothetical protein [Candidatus Giovannonibacteria bacterium]
MTKKHVLLAVSALVFLLVTFFISSGVEKNTAQAAVGDIIASYDFEDGRVPDPGGVGFQTQIPAAILTDPDGNHFLRMTASPSDAGINGGPPFYTFGNTVRSELDVGVFDWWTYNPVTVSFSMRILSATPPFSDGTMLAQFFQYGNNSGWVAALAGGPNFMAFTAKDGDQYELRPSLDAVNLPPDQWVNVSMTVFFSANVGGGQISVSVNGQNVGSFSARTLKNTNDPMHFILDFYGDPVFPYGTVDFDNIVLSSGSTAPPLPSTSSCHILDSSQAVPTGFGASYNVLSSAQELLLKAN